VGDRNHWASAQGWGRARWEAVTWSAAPYDAWFEKPWGRYANAVENAAVLAALGPLSGRQVLDAGCGTGLLLAQMSDTAGSAVGVDRDRAMLDVARTHSAAPLLQADAGALPLGAASVDAVVAVALLEFVSDPAAVVAEMWRVTRPGGQVVIGSLNPKSPWGLAHRRHLRREPWTEARFFSRRELLRLGRVHGPARLAGALFMPGAVPGLSRLGPLIEPWAIHVPSLGAFQVLVIERREPWT
jgi:SAM-dependent methyltransferase